MDEFLKNVLKGIEEDFKDTQNINLISLGMKRTFGDDVEKDTYGIACFIVGIVSEVLVEDCSRRHNRPPTRDERNEIFEWARNSLIPLLEGV